MLNCEPRSKPLVSNPQGGRLLKSLHSERGGLSMRRRITLGTGVFTALALVFPAACTKKQPQPGTVLDEAMRAERKADSFKPSGDPYFHDMDGGVPLSADEQQGRNTWIVWTGGNDRFWDVISVRSAGALDFLKTLSSYPGVSGKGGLPHFSCHAWPHCDDRKANDQQRICPQWLRRRHSQRSKRANDG